MDKCVTCRFNTNDYVCHPHCGGCDGKSNYERGNFKLKNYNELAKIIHANAVDHGWWDTDRDFAEIVALIHSELSEALEEYRAGGALLYFVCKLDGVSSGDECADTDGDCYFRTGDSAHCEKEKPEGIAVELADVVIRILDYCGRRGLEIDAALEVRKAGFDAYTLPALVAECHYLLSMAYKEIEPRSLYFVECISLIDFWLKENGGDLDEAIALKHEYNKSRPYRHGGKKR